eukprot:TCONS_00073486-protein
MSSESQLNDWTVKQLQEELKKRKLSIYGRKSVLVERLFDLAKTEEVRNRNSEMMSTDNENTVKHTQSSEELKEQRHQDREQRKKIVIWRKPLLTIHYFILELFELIKQEKESISKHRKTCSILAIISFLVLSVYTWDGPHQSYVSGIEKYLLWCGYWVGLGILSSVGLGTGLHTFLLYLGPHIAKVTLAAWECGSLNFPEPPYPETILCPDSVADDSSTPINMFSIMSKVRLEAVMWGAGTAIGELPPYFMARAARLSGEDDVDNEDLEELEDLISSDDQGLFTRLKKAVPQIVERVGFFGILAFASIPNPLFDLAGITCGHCLVPFWTFFGATLIGKSIIKMHIQQTFVILCFSKRYVEQLLEFLSGVPYVGSYIQYPLERAVRAQKSKLHGASSGKAGEDGNILGFIFEKFVTIMVVYFIISIVNSLAQSYAKKVDETKRQLNNGVGVVPPKADKAD